MTKTIITFWLVHLLISIVLYFYYRIVIIETKSFDIPFLGEILYILEIWANFSFSMVYLWVMILGFLSFFLNLIKKVKDNTFFSFIDIFTYTIKPALFF